MRNLLLALGLSSFLMLSACAKQDEAAADEDTATEEKADPATE